MSLQLEDHSFVNREFDKIVYVFRCLHDTIPPGDIAAFVSQGLQSGFIYYNFQVNNQDIFVILKDMGWVPGSQMIICCLVTELNRIKLVRIATPVALSDGSSSYVYFSVFQHAVAALICTYPSYEKPKWA